MNFRHYTKGSSWGLDRCWCDLTGHVTYDQISLFQIAGELYLLVDMFWYFRGVEARSSVLGKAYFECSLRLSNIVFWYFRGVGARSSVLGKAYFECSLRLSNIVCWTIFSFATTTDELIHWATHFLEFKSILWFTLDMFQLLCRFHKRSDPVRLDHSLDLLCGVFHVWYTDWCCCGYRGSLEYGYVSQLSFGRLGCSPLCIAQVE